MIPVGILTAAATSSFVGLLDLYPGAAAAYSLRKLRNAYTGAAIRVRRSSDGAQTDIGFISSGDLDTTTLLTFVGVGNGSIFTWYDQSGNSKNATNVVTTSNLIVIAGILQTINSKAAISLPVLTITPFTVIGDLSYIMVQRKISSNAPGINVGSAPSAGLLFSSWNDNNIYFQRSNGTTGFIIGAADATTGNQLLNAFNSAGSMSMYKNNNIYTLSLNTTFSIANSQIQNIGQANGLLSNGLGAELIVYTNSQLANRTGINTNINTYYSIY